MRLLVTHFYEVMVLPKIIHWARVGMIAFAVLLSAAAMVTTTQAVAQTSATPTIGSFISNLEIDTLDGEQFVQSAHEGKVLVFNFWGQWCDPCLEELPLLQQLRDELPQTDVYIGAVNTDGREYSDGMRRTFARIGVSLPILLDDDGRVNRRFSRSSLTPFTVVIAPNGQIVWTKFGFDEGTMAQLRVAIRTARAMKR